MAEDIRDGYTFWALIAEQPKLYAATRFTYRPALIEEQAEVYEKAGRQTAKQAERTIGACIVAHIVEWDAKDFRGKDAARTVDGFVALPPRLARKIRDIVFGAEAPDEGGTSDAQADAKN
jgi:hypothetical protein